MNIFFILVGISVVGILVVFWLLKNEDKPLLRNFGAPMPAMTSPPPPQAKKSSMLAGLFAKFKKEKEEASKEESLKLAEKQAKEQKHISKDKKVMIQRKALSR